MAGFTSDFSFILLDGAIETTEQRLRGKRRRRHEGIRVRIRCLSHHDRLSLDIRLLLRTKTGLSRQVSRTTWRGLQTQMGEVEIRACLVAGGHCFLQAFARVVAVEDYAVDGDCEDFDYYFDGGADEGPLLGRGVLVFALWGEFELGFRVRCWMAIVVVAVRTAKTSTTR